MSALVPMATPSKVIVS